SDIDRAANVCVLGQTLVDQLFGDRTAIGESVRVKDQTCAVVGVLAVKGQTATGQDQDDTFLMPYTTVMKKIVGRPWIDDIMCTATSASVVDRAEEEITLLLRERHHVRPGAEDDFNLRHPTEIAAVVKQSTQTMELLLAAIASVSLVVGGIGIMNIMLVSVTERTREIGLRMAIGARAADVRLQFLIEALILSLNGGARPDFLAETADIRQGDWRVAPPPADLRDRRVEITGPVDRKMIINALNSGAQVFMADFEDANSPTWANVVRGQQNLIDAVR